ncbi:hypothetical protein [Thiohalorhabdus methylotrophus]|uniref:Flavodoxin-like fold domain-containing protein n=1 Tax=Thiohalorhabdus methylotrophus TaxID=3242694 RepID=A0ABV4TTN0_9GAMM
MRVLLILGHPRRESFGDALFRAFGAVLRKAGVELRTLAVRWGPRKVTRAAAATGALSAVPAWWLAHRSTAADLYGPLIYLALVLDGMLLPRLARPHMRVSWTSLPIPLVTALTFILWFGVLPLIRLG